MGIEDYEIILQEENERNKEFKELVDNNKDLFSYLWGDGDGDGGYVFGAIREAVTGEFFKSNKPKLSGAYVKKKITHILQKKVFERDKYRCVMCSTHLDLTVDHIHPEVLGGSLDLSNLQTLCKSCNSRKGAKI